MNDRFIRRIAGVPAIPALQKSTVGILFMVVLVGMGERPAERFPPIYLLAVGALTAMGNLFVRNPFVLRSLPFSSGWRARLRTHVDQLRDVGVDRCSFLRRRQVIQGFDLELFDGLAKRLKTEGYEAAAANLDELLHGICWTSSSEMIGELGLALVEFQRDDPRMSPMLRRLLDRCMETVRRVWPSM